MKREKLMICSFPKAKTYLAANILSELGLYNLGWHIGFDKTMISNHADGKIIDFSMPPDQVKGITRHIDINCNAALSMMPPGSFAVSHLPPHVITPETLRGMSFIFLFRDPRKCMISSFKYMRDILPEEPSYQRVSCIEDIQERFEAYLVNEIAVSVRLWSDMLNWGLMRNALSIDMDTLTSDQDGAELISSIAQYAGFPEVATNAALAGKIYQSAINRGSPTKNLESLTKVVWSPACEKVFHHFGGTYITDTLMPRLRQSSLSPLKQLRRTD